MVADRVWTEQRVKEMSPAVLWIELGLHKGFMGTKERKYMKEGQAQYWGSPIDYYWLGYSMRGQMLVGALYEDGRQVHPLQSINDLEIERARPDKPLMGPASFEHRTVQFIQREKHEAKQVLLMLQNASKRPTINKPSGRPVILKKAARPVIKRKGLPFRIKEKA